MKLPNISTLLENGKKNTYVSDKKICCLNDEICNINYKKCKNKH